ncbi:hypothetical protein CDAR_75821 [Caerostris darwini]|uniref:Uncharacterized protein n=1 Tax=Caerostris darwini TaxID=1538125 RepID=A0AAV4W1G7_9ARAC|nr:hypothetical protein CDAR_75821 [Caerostris darwini]
MTSVCFELSSQYAPVGKFMTNFDAEIYAIHLAINNLIIRVNDYRYSEVAKRNSIAKMRLQIAIIIGKLMASSGGNNNSKDSFGESYASSGGSGGPRPAALMRRQGHGLRPFSWPVTT